MFDIIRCCFLFTLFVITDIILLDDKKGIFCVLIESSDYMPKYYLVATDINGVTNILLSKEKITKLDKFILVNFKIIKHFFFLIKKVFSKMCIISKANG